METYDRQIVEDFRDMGLSRVRIRMKDDADEQLAFATFVAQALEDAGIPFTANSDTKFYERVENQILTGSNGCLLPHGTATRAQVSAILSRFSKGP